MVETTNLPTQLPDILRRQTRIDASRTTLIAHRLLIQDISTPVNIGGKELLLRVHYTPTHQTQSKVYPELVASLRTPHRPEKVISRRTLSVGEIYESKDNDDPRQRVLWTFWSANQPDGIYKEPEGKLMTLYEMSETDPLERRQGYASYLFNQDPNMLQIYLALLKQSNTPANAPEHTLFIVTGTHPSAVKLMRRLSQEKDSIWKLLFRGDSGGDSPQWARVLS